MTSTEIKDCTTCKYGFVDEQFGFPMCHHPKRFSDDCIDFNMHEEKEIKESEKPIPNDLEEAADEYEKKHTYQRYNGGGLTPEYNATLAEAFIAGYNLCKEQMMKEAVEGEIRGDIRSQEEEPYQIWAESDFLQLDEKFEIGDKVRIIIVKED